MKHTQSHGDAFSAWVLDNFDVVDEVIRLTRQYIEATGATRIGIDLPIAQIRWDRHISTHSADFKVNNNHLPYLARLIMATKADLEGVYELRRSDEADAWIQAFLDA